MTDQDHAKIVREARVTQADREAAADIAALAGCGGKQVYLICNGSADDHPYVHIIMTHRLAAEAAAFEKAAGVLEQAIGDGYETPAVKGDQCVHGRFGWEDCIACYDKELLRTATAIRKLAGEKHD